MFTVGHFISRYKTFELVTAHLQEATQKHTASFALYVLCVDFSPCDRIVSSSLLLPDEDV